MELSILRFGLSFALSIGYWDANTRIARSSCTSLSHTSNRRQIEKPISSAALRALKVVFLGSVMLFTCYAFPLLSSGGMVLSYLIVARKYLSLPSSQYPVYTSRGRVQWHTFHHLHLSGLCALGALAAAIVDNVIPGPHSSRVFDQYLTSIICACIGAHYFMAALGKTAHHGLRWANSRVMPFYTALLRSYTLGDTGRDSDNTLQDWILKNPVLGIFLLMVTWVIEACGVIYAVYPISRPYIGMAWVAMHTVIWYMFRIDFRESGFIIGVFTLLPIIISWSA